MLRLGNTQVAIFGLLAVMTLHHRAAASTTFTAFTNSLDPFNSNVYNASGSDSGLASTSTSTLTHADSADDSFGVNGFGADRISLDVTSTTPRLRHLANGGTPSTATQFATSSGTDGWIGFYIKTTVAGWNAQLYIEPGVSNPATGSNGSTPKTIIADGVWHAYDWNLDDTTGGTDGWGSVAGIVTGLAIVGDGNHTIDSIIFSNPAATPGTNATFLLDYVALNSNGRIDAPIPEPTSLALMSLTLAGAVLRRRG